MLDNSSKASIVDLVEAPITIVFLLEPDTSTTGVPVFPIVVEEVNLVSVFAVPDTATDVPLVPDVPVVPDVPLVADVPEVPDVPVVPEVPLVADVPEVPDVPVVPEVPAVADVPEVPLVPSPPEAPSKLVVQVE